MTVLILSDIDFGELTLGEYFLYHPWQVIYDHTRREFLTGNGFFSETEPLVCVKIFYSGCHYTYDSSSFYVEAERFLDLCVEAFHNVD